MGYIKSLKNEWKNITWINKRDLLSTVTSVIVIGILLTTYIYGVDSIAEMVSKLIIEKI